MERPVLAAVAAQVPGVGQRVPNSHLCPGATSCPRRGSGNHRRDLALRGTGFLPITASPPDWTASRAGYEPGSGLPSWTASPTPGCGTTAAGTSSRPARTGLSWAMDGGPRPGCLRVLESVRGSESSPRGRPALREPIEQNGTARTNGRVGVAGRRGAQAEKPVMALRGLNCLNHGIQCVRCRILVGACKGTGQDLDADQVPPRKQAQRGLGGGVRVVGVLDQAHQDSVDCGRSGMSSQGLARVSACHRVGGAGGVEQTRQVRHAASVRVRGAGRGPLS